MLTKIGIALKKVIFCGRQHIKIDHWVLDCHPPPNVGNPQLLYLLHSTGWVLLDGKYIARGDHILVIIYVKFSLVYI